jgi:hypothetical protein
MVFDGILIYWPAWWAETIAEPFQDMVKTSNQMTFEEALIVFTSRFPGAMPSKRLVS